MSETGTPEKLHSSLGASVSARWIACPGSINLSRGIEQTDNIHAQAGRAAHVVAELCLKNNDMPSRFVEDKIEVGKDAPPVQVTEEMVNAVDVFVDYCRSILTERHWIEQSFDLSSLGRPDMFGTADFVSYDPELKQLEVVDLKYGSGVLVEVKGNPQLRYYALGAALTLGALPEVEIERIKITIVQPRMQHPDGVVRSETLDYFELLDFAGELMEYARRTDDPAAPLNAGSHCRFCPALAICPAQRAQAQAIAQVTFENMPVDRPPEPETLPDEILDDLISKAPLLKDWLSALDGEAERRLRAGRPLTAVKLVEKRPTRKWVDPEKTRAYLLEEAGLYAEEIHKEPELKSPAQIEKLVGKKKLPTELVVKVSSGYKLAPASDPRPALPAGPSEAFAALPPASE